MLAPFIISVCYCDRVCSVLVASFALTVSAHTRGLFREADSLVPRPHPLFNVTRSKGNIEKWVWPGDEARRQMGSAYTRLYKR